MTLDSTLPAAAYAGDEAPSCHVLASNRHTERLNGRLAMLGFMAWFGLEWQVGHGFAGWP